MHDAAQGLHQDVDDPPGSRMSRNIHLAESIRCSLEYHGTKVYNTVHKAHRSAGGKHLFCQFFFQPEIFLRRQHIAVVAIYIDTGQNA